MITLYALPPDRPSIDINPFIQTGNITWSDIGDESVNVTVTDHDIMRDLLREPLGLPVQAIENGRSVWSGRLSTVSVNSDAIELTALGDVYRLEDQLDYSAFWSKVGTNDWKQVSENEITRGTSYDQLTYPVTTVSGIINDAFRIDFNNRVYISYAPNASIANNQSATVMFELPYDSATDITFIQTYLRFRLPTNWVVRTRGVDAFGNVTDNYTNLVGNNNLQLFGLFSENRTPSRRYIVQVVNETGGTYTNTQVDGFWFVEFRHMRMMTTSVDNLSTTLVGNTVAGSGIIFTPASMAGIYPGALVTFTNGNTETLQVLSTDSSTFTADAERTHANGNTLRISRLTASTVVSGICSAFSSAIIATTNEDIPNTSFSNTTPRKAIEELLNDAYVYDVRGGLFRFYSVPSGELPYFLDQSSLVLSKDAESLTTHTRASYTSFVGFDRTTPYITTTNAQLLERRRRIDVQSNNVTIASGVALSALARKSNNIVKLIPTGGMLYNTSNAFVSFPVTNTPIVFKNIIPELFQIGNTTYYLKRVTYNLETREYEYVVEEQEETIETLLAGK